MLEPNNENYQIADSESPSYSGITAADAATALPPLWFWLLSIDPSMTLVKADIHIKKSSSDSAAQHNVGASNILAFIQISNPNGLLEERGVC